jgi:hypothetical protein
LSLIFYPSSSDLGKWFGIVVLYMFTTYSSLVCGVVLILLRLSKILRKPSNFVYVLVGMLNVIAGITAICLLMLHRADLGWVHTSLLNLLVGGLMAWDVVIYTN